MGDSTPFNSSRLYFGIHTTASSSENPWERRQPCLLQSVRQCRKQAGRDSCATRRVLIISSRRNATGSLPRNIYRDGQDDDDPTTAPVHRNSFQIICAKRQLCSNPDCLPYKS